MQFAFLFPGQGSQRVGMLGELTRTEESVRQTFAEASQVLGRDLLQMVREGPEEELNRTENTQPALLAAGVAIQRLWDHRGGAVPHYMAGHSLGEYTALVAAGSLDFSDALQIVTERGRLMEEAVPEGKGKMVAVLGLQAEEVMALTREITVQGQVAIANFNAPDQVVLAGECGPVDAVAEAACAKGARRTVVLPLSTPSHCGLMEPAAKRLAERLSSVVIRPPAVPVLNNVDVASPSNPAQIRDALVRQLVSPVRWTELIQRLSVQYLFELGPGKVLCGLSKRIERGVKCMAVPEGSGLDEALKTVQ